MKRMTVTLKRLLAASTCALAVAGFGLTAHADRTLSSDETWTAAELETKMTGVIDLNGHTLTVPELKGTATITDTLVRYELLSNIQFPVGHEIVSKDYELLDSITSSGAQYILTDVEPTVNTKLEMDFRIGETLPANGDCIFGATKWGTGQFGLARMNEIFEFLGTTTGTLRPKLVPCALNSDYHVSINGSVNGSVKMTNLTTQVEATSGSGFKITLNSSLGNKLTLFGLSGSGETVRMVPMTFKRLWISESGVEHTFVPVRQVSTGKCGVLDLEAYRANPGTGFYGNATANADFTAGTVTNVLCAIRHLGALRVNLPSDGLSSFDVLFDEDAVLAVTNKSVTLKGNLTFVIPSTLESGTHTLIAADEVVSDGAVLTAIGSDRAENYALGVSTDGLYVQILPTYAKIDATSGAWQFYKAEGQPYLGWEGGVTADIDVRFSTAAEAAMLATKAEEFANAKAVLLDADIELTADADWSALGFDMNGHAIDLKGNKLTVLQLAGVGTITDSTGQGYEFLDSITSTAKQCIRTDVVPTANTKLELDFSTGDTELSNGYCVFGVDRWANGNFALARVDFGSTVIWQLLGNTDSSKKANLGRYALNTSYHVSIGGGCLQITNLGAGTATTVNNYVITFAGLLEKRLSLFGLSGHPDNTYLLEKKPSRMVPITFTRLWIQDGDGTEHTFVPVRNLQTGKCGVLDLEEYRANPASGFYGNVATPDEDFTAGTVTNVLCVTPPGELHVLVAAGTTENTTVALRGNVKLVKEGAGTFVAAKTGQTYFGSTEVAAGTFKVATDDEKANQFAGAAGNVVRVEKDATLDVNGNPGFDTHPLILAGGTVVSAVGQKSSSETAPAASLGSITLEADSTVTPNRFIYQRESVDLGGHLLTVRLAGGMHYVLTEGALFTGAGTVNVTNGGYTRFDGTVTRDMSQVNLILNSALKVEADITVNDLELLWMSGNNFAVGDGHIYIKGVFKPTSANGYHRNCVMLDGSTLNLAGKTEAWPLEPKAPTSGVQACTPLVFAENATVTVSLGGRKVKNEQIVEWQTANEPSDTVRFVLEPNLNARLVRQPGGLWLQTGFLIRIR